MDNVKKLGDDPEKEEEVEEETEEEEDLDEPGEDEDDPAVEPDDPEEEPDVDHKAELDKVKKKLGGKVDKERGKRILAEKSKGLSKEEVQEIVKEETAQIEKKVFRGRAEELADRLSETPAEKELILHHYDHSINHSESIEDDIENAYALANKNRNKSRITELQKAAKSKKTRIGSSGGGAPAKTKKTQKYSKDIIDGAEFAGTTPEKFAKSLEDKQK